MFYVIQLLNFQFRSRHLIDNSSGFAHRHRHLKYKNASHTRNHDPFNRPFRHHHLQNAQPALSKRLHLHKLCQKQRNSNRKFKTLRTSPKNVLSLTPLKGKNNVIWLVSLSCRVCLKQKPVQAYSKTQLLKAAPSRAFPSLLCNVNNDSLRCTGTSFPWTCYVYYPLCSTPRLIVGVDVVVARIVLLNRRINWPVAFVPRQCHLRHLRKRKGNMLKKRLGPSFL